MTTLLWAIVWIAAGAVVARVLMPGEEPDMNDHCQPDIYALPDRATVPEWDRITGNEGEAERINRQMWESLGPRA